MRHVGSLGATDREGVSLLDEESRQNVYFFMLFLSVLFSYLKWNMRKCADF